jgi:hypothetical protein
MESAVINQEKIKYFQEIMKNIKNDIKKNVEYMKQNKIDFITMGSILLLLEDLIFSTETQNLGLIRNIGEFLPYNDTINTAIMSAAIITASKIIKVMLNKFKVKPTIQKDNLHDDLNLKDDVNQESHLENKNNQTQINENSTNIQKMSENFRIRFENPSFKSSENKRTDINKNTNIAKNVSTLLKKETEKIRSFVNESSLTNITKINNEISLSQ